MFVFANVAVPSTVRSLSNCTLLLGTKTFPVPLALSSKSAFVSIVSIKLSLTLIPSKLP